MTGQWTRGWHWTTCSDLAYWLFQAPNFGIYISKILARKSGSFKGCSNETPVYSTREEDEGRCSVVDSGHPLRCPEWWTLVWSLEEGGGQQVEQMIIEGSCKVGWKCSSHTGHCRLPSV